MNKKEISLQIKKLRKDSMVLRDLTHDQKLSFEKSSELRKEQDKIYKKMLFYEKMLKAIDKKE